MLRTTAGAMLSATCIAACLIACETVPLTGRQQLSLLPESQLTAMALDSYRQVLSEATLSTEPAQIDQVRRVGARIAQATEAYLRSNGYSTTDLAWEFNVIRDDATINAWAMPGGKVAVYTGILRVTQGDAGLATVLGHEIGHAVAKHGNERMSQGLIVQMGGEALSVALRNRPAQTQSLFLQSYGAIGQYGVLLPYSRLQETEADRIGLVLMAMAGYDPRAAIPFWERMAAQGGARPPELLSSHPAPATRIDAIRASLPEAMTYIRAQ